MHCIQVSGMAVSLLIPTYLCLNMQCMTTVKPALSDNVWAKKRWSLNRGGLLIEMV